MCYAQCVIRHAADVTYDALFPDWAYIVVAVQLIPPDVYTKIHHMLPEAMHTAQRMLAHTLQMEAKYARHAKQRRGDVTDANRHRHFHLAVES